MSLLQVHKGAGVLLSYLRNLPEMKKLYGERGDSSGYCFHKGSRGRGNGTLPASPMCGSNIWLADERECVIITQSEKSRGPLQVRVYDSPIRSNAPIHISDEVWRIIRQYDLPYVEDS